MDIHELQSWTTLLLIITFVGIVVWAYSKRRHKDFDEAANLPLEEPEHPQNVKMSSTKKQQRGDHE